MPRRVVDRGISRQRLVGRHARLPGIPGCTRKRDWTAARAARTSADGRSRRCRRTRTSWPSRSTWRRAARCPAPAQCGDVTPMPALPASARGSHGRPPRKPAVSPSPSCSWPWPSPSWRSALPRVCCIRCPSRFTRCRKPSRPSNAFARRRRRSPTTSWSAGAGPVSGWGARAIPAWPAVLPCRWAGEPLAYAAGRVRPRQDAHQHRGDAPRRAAGHRGRGPRGSRQRHSRCAPLGLRALPPGVPLSRRCPRDCGRRLRGMGRRARDRRLHRRPDARTRRVHR